MILLYHKIDRKSSGNLTIDIYHFIKQMLAIRNKHIVYLDDYDPYNPEHVVITFDDGYKDIIFYALPVLQYFHYVFEMFIVDDFFRMANDGNLEFLDKDDIKILLHAGGRLEYHSKSHPHLEDITMIEALEEEVKPPEYLLALDNKGCDWFAYPFCTYNDKVVSIVQKYFKGARSGKGLGNDGSYALESIGMDNDIRFEYKIKPWPIALIVLYVRLIIC
jgi:peptidoglycan/xylan/chitin deacetylase (PgdA/CDA1 family)